MVKKEVINIRSPKAGPYSLGIKAGDLIFISGQVPNSDDKNIKNQTLTVLGKIKAILEEAGANVSNIVKVGIFLKSITDFTEMNQVYKEFFEQNGVNEKFPARSTVQALCPLPTALIEIDAIAMI